ncbi:MAG: hypothetical protein KatS3mg035_1252 [Bacteroidia bacterium]|nr:MAG: hypothetical protein KatS3mg035_1252 [Bacteroidia bacterium]
MPLIKKKKKVYPVSENLLKYLQQYGRGIRLPIEYADLLRYETSISLYDKKGNDTLWSTVIFPENERNEIYENLRKIYAILKTNGDEQLMRHLYIERIDICEYGNTLPFRVKIVNRFNENYDYFYIKQADASRILGLELEHLLSPNRINYVVHNETLIEEHIPGIPGELFIKQFIKSENSYLDEIRLAKEFVKFNERCFVRLLGDMHCNNFVIELTPDFDETHYRMRSIDFDQQCYEGNIRVYMPQYFKENNPIIYLGIKGMTPETVKQYQKEERAVMRYRVRSQRYQIKDFMDMMVLEEIAPKENVEQLKESLAHHYKEPKFLKYKTMGGLLKQSLKMLFND